jgi:phosphatidylglycerol:prolipoprotein diacylglycerol transferase
MYPEIFHIGSFPINTYGVFLAVAFLCAILIAVKLAKRDGLPYEKIYDLSLWMLLAGLVGSKILMFLTEPEYRENPAQFLSLDFLRSGGVWYGGLLGAVFAGYFLMKHYGLTHVHRASPSAISSGARDVLRRAVAGVSQPRYRGV